MALRPRYRLLIDAHLAHGTKLFCGIVHSLPSDVRWPNLIAYVHGVEPTGLPAFMSSYTKDGADKAALLLATKYPEYIGRITIERIKCRRSTGSDSNFLKAARPT